MTDVTTRTATDTVVLGKNQYGKAENHVVRVDRATARHEPLQLVPNRQGHHQGTESYRYASKPTNLRVASQTFTDLRMKYKL